MEETKVFTRFIDQLKNPPEASDLKYFAGRVAENIRIEDFVVAYEQMGAQETFSVGQPIYDADGNLMGYLGLAVFGSLDYSCDVVRVPVETWKICLPTKHCKVGKNIYTYWQNKEKGASK